MSILKEKSMNKTLQLSLLLLAVAVLTGIITKVIVNAIPSIEKMVDTLLRL
jgi:hypothetical protein